MKRFYLFVIIVMLILISCDKHVFENSADTDIELASMEGSLVISQLTDSSVRLSWQQNQDVSDKYLIERKINSDGTYTVLAEVSADLVSYLDLELLISNTYYYRVTGCNDENITNSIENSISTSFAEIDNFNAQQQLLTSALLIWEHDCSYETGYVLERREISRSAAISSKKIDNELQAKVMKSRSNERDGYEIIAELPANTNQYLDENTQPYYQYEYRLEAFSDYNESSYINTGIEMIFQSPDNFQIIQTNVHTFYLEWNDNSEGESGFKIERKIDAGEFEEIHTTQENIHNFTDDINQRNTFNTVYYRIRAFYNDEYSSYAENSCQINFLPVENLSYEIVNIYTISLSWEDNNEGEDGFILQKKVNSGSWSELANTDTVNYIDAQAEVNNILQYRVAPYSGENIVNYVETDEINNQFYAPDNFQKTQINVHTFYLEWNDNSEGESGFKIERKIDAGEFEEIHTTLENTQNFTDDINQRNTFNTVYYRIRAYYDVEYSSYAENHCQIDFLPIENLSYEIFNIHTISLIWEDNNVGEDGFIIQKQVNSGNWSELANTDTISYIDVQAEVNDTLQYRVAPYSGNNIVDYVETEEISNLFLAPTDPNIEMHTITSCDLTWQDNSEGETGFRIDRKKDSDEWIENYQLLGENIESYTDNNLQVYSTYQYRIYAYYEDEVSTSIEGEITMIYPAPTDFAITVNYFTSCLLSWNYNEIGDEEGFKIERRLINGTWDFMITLPISNTDYEDIGLSAEETYEYMVYAYNSECEGNSATQTIELNFQIEGMVFVEGGTFEMGDHYNEASDDELPVHEVTLSSFFIGQYEVTQDEYETVMGSNPAHNYGVGDNYPVYYLTWYNAVEYCNALSIQENLTPCYDLTDWSCNFSADGYRLPTEAEWEYAARGGVNWTDDYRYSGTTDNLVDYAWYNSNSGEQTHEVGTKLPNQLDIYDMSGNVCEWCNDRYLSSYYNSSPANNPPGPDSGFYRVLRGGYWGHGAIHCRVADRDHNYPGSYYYIIGFRILRTFN